MFFFGVSTGRCGTMTLANALNSEKDTLCLHEGKVRLHTESLEQWLPYLTLQNLQAYKYPTDSAKLFLQFRECMSEVKKKAQVTFLGDIAYNYAPFVAAIPRIFPDSKIIYMYRDGRDFVKSVYTAENPDETPVGWLDDRKLSTVERFVSLGRLKPNNTEISVSKWREMHPVEKNSWLWSETNKIILEGLKTWKNKNVYMLRFEEFFEDPITNYELIRKFIGITGRLSDKTTKLFSKPINKRKTTILPDYASWDDNTKDMFFAYASEIMQKLGYV